MLSNRGGKPTGQARKPSRYSRTATDQSERHAPWAAGSSKGDYAALPSAGDALLPKPTVAGAFACGSWQKIDAAGAIAGWAKDVPLQREGWTVNSKRVYRIHHGREADESVQTQAETADLRQGARCVVGSACKAKNETWTMDFLQDALSPQKLRTLSIEDAYTREMLAIEADTSLPALRVVRASTGYGNIEVCQYGLSRLIGTGSSLRRCSGPVGLWRTRSHCTSSHRWTADGERLASKASMASSVRMLNEHWFLTLDDARETIESWRNRLQPGAPAQRLGYLTPECDGNGLCKRGKQKRFPLHLHSLDGGCELNLQLNSNPECFTYTDFSSGAARPGSCLC